MRKLTSGIRSLVITAGIGVAAGMRLRSFRERLAADSAALNDTLPVHSLWWRTHAKERGELLYVAIGDSAAQGIGASHPGNSYVGILADQVRVATGRTVRVINLSVSGATVRLAVQDQLPRFARLSPDLVTVAIGANDIADWDAAVFETGIRRVFEALPSHALVAELPCFHLPAAERKVAEANRILHIVAAERGLTVVPLHAVTKRPGMRSVATHVAKDLFHPNDRGYQVWADAFRPSLTASVEQRFTPTDTPEPESVRGRG
ncbi:SGNH/GDSL hydrolase family protein [Cryobacterium sp. CG_9.6]|uniref:SGNH/GDSL hydrolase family protein n=1 Tax=Cryobacterium sp. CG_9.6 TaxID=2760710 RepID=UPI002473362C|nr:SGNH/GDSL hydrolase family protein [Cryobacterium sp. CG_9.6]MDH6238239.1 lysophospholipase L1-like esterase [Cryobacterium sp. CG_9.6]